MKFISPKIILLSFALFWAGLPNANAEKPEPAAPYSPAFEYSNISRALFKTGVLRANDPAAVEEYLRIAQCGLFEQYGTNDVVWSRIREAQAYDLGLNIPNFNERLEVVGNLELGNYDSLSGGFLIKDNALENLSIVSIYENTSGSLDECQGNQYRSFVPRVHPLRLRARLSQTFNLKTIPLSFERADALIRKIAKDAENTNNPSSRPVTMVLRLTLGGQDPLSSTSNPTSINVAAELEELLIYEGPERKELLFRREFKK